VLKLLIHGGKVKALYKARGDLTRIMLKAPARNGEMFPFNKNGEMSLVKNPSTFMASLSLLLLLT
jgi:hypothetical protein